MSQSQTFRTTLFQDGNNTGIEVPADILESLGAGKRPAVLVAVEGTPDTDGAPVRRYEYRSTIASMGGRSLISFSKDRRETSGIHGGDPIEVTLTLDTAPRTVEVPADLAAALDAAEARAAFDALAFTHRKEHVRAVEDAKTDATRQRRIAAAVAKVAGA